MGIVKNTYVVIVMSIWIIPVFSEEPKWQRLTISIGSVFSPDYEWRRLNKEVESYCQGADYERALILAYRVLDIAEHRERINISNVATSLCNLGVAYNGLENYVEAEYFLRRSLDIRNEILEPSNRDLTFTLFDLAKNCIGQGRYKEAVLLCGRALDNNSNTNDPDRCELFELLKNIALFQETYSDEVEGLKIFVDATETAMKYPQRYDIIFIYLDRMADYYHRQGHRSNSSLLRSNSTIYEKSNAKLKKISLMDYIGRVSRYYHREKISLTEYIDQVSRYYRSQDYYECSEQIYKYSIYMYEKSKPYNHELPTKLELLACVLRDMGRIEESTQLQFRADDIRFKKR